MSSNVCKRLKVLEKGLGEPDDNDEGVKEVLELLWQYEKAIEHFRQCPNYAELDLELAQSTVRRMIEQGLWKNTEPVNKVGTSDQEKQDLEE